MQRSGLLSTYLVGLALLLPLVLFFYRVGFRVGDRTVVFISTEWAAFIGLAFVSAWLVGVFEETLFRGVFFQSLRKKWSFWTATSVTSFVYAAVHFIGGEVVEPAQVAWYSGFVMVAEAFSQFEQPVQIWDSFVSLFLLGVLFCHLREKFGLWHCIALHSAWVFGIRVFKEMTVRDIVNPFAGWVGTYDHFVGNLVSVWLLFIFVVLALVQLQQKNR